MKKNYKSTLICVAFACYSIISNAQTGVTKLGTNALSNNTTDGIYNTALGHYSLNQNTIGNKNTGCGANTLRFNIDGITNTAVGYASLYRNTNGLNNTAVGAYSLFENKVGQANTALGTYSLNKSLANYNTAVGHLTLSENISGESNTAIGYRALNFNTTGYQNTAIGDQSLYTNGIGNYNTATGYHALHNNSSGSHNTANGYNALYSNIGEDNAAFGDYALYSNQTGKRNTAIGSRYTLWQNTTGDYNTACGSNALYSNSEGGENTAIGAFALNYNKTGTNNTANGNSALLSNTTGSFNTGLGYLADVTKSDLTNATAIGYNAKVDASNKVRIGNTSVTSIGGHVGWTTFSDGRYKKNIKEDIPGLAFINMLRPISYTVNVKGLDEYYNKGRNQSTTSKAINKEDIIAMQKAEDAAGKIIHNGFIAQEVDAAAMKLNFKFDGVDKPENKDDLYGLRYENFIVPLVKAVQELSTTNEILKKQNEEQQQQIDELRMIISTNSKADIFLKDASLEQNIPNPSSGSTTIKYSLPQKFTNAQIVIVDKKGQVLKQTNISGSGKGTININVAALPAGTYNYSLIVDGRIISSKQMMLAK